MSSGRTVDSVHGSSIASRMIGEVVATRLSAVIEEANGSRVVYAMADLGKEVTCSIGTRLATMAVPGGRIDVAIHPELATEEFRREYQSSITEEAATWFRNHRPDSSVIATVFSVSGERMEEVLQSLGSVQRINHSWILDSTKAAVWADHTLPSYKHSPIHRDLEMTLKGLMDSDVLASATMLAEFCVSIRESMTGPSGLELKRAINHALPNLRLPRDCMSDNELKSLSSTPGPTLSKLRDDFQQYLFLRDRKGGVRLRKDMLEEIRKLFQNGTLSESNQFALVKLVNDREITTGMWQPSQRCVSEIRWEEIRQFFLGSSQSTPQPLGLQTIQFLDDDHPGMLEDEERTILQSLGKRVTANPELERVYFRHCERLKERPSLYKKWHHVIFNKPIQEVDDLLAGLVCLAERSSQAVDGLDDHVVVIQLRNAQKKSFWTKEKNIELCAFLRDRYRGIDKLLSPHVELRFGRCWDGDWDSDSDIDGGSKKGGASREFEFEAYVVPRSRLDELGHLDPVTTGSPTAQLTWAPDHQSFASALASDLRRVLPQGELVAGLIRSRIKAARGSSGARTDRPTLERITSIIDSQGQSEGALANRGDDDTTSEWSEIGKFWPDRLKARSKGILSDSQQTEALQLFEQFRSSYTSAIEAMVSKAGLGLADPALVTQAEDYGKLLAWLRRHAVSDVLVQEVWEPLLQIGTATIPEDVPTMIVAPWHPLRLLELAAKAHQGAKVIQRIVESASEEAVAIQDFANDRLRSLGDSYYANVGLVRTEMGPRLFVETEHRAGYSLLQPVATDFGPSQSSAFLEEPVTEVVQRFGEIAKHYLDLNPHDRANFSVVLFDSESDDLPVMVAQHLARQVAEQSDLRCDLTVTHSDRQKLRTIYERQNRRIGRELESSLTSEAARTFLSRLRIGITPYQSLSQSDDTQEQDVLLLHDVLARTATEEWHERQREEGSDKPLDHSPNDASRRRGLTHGSLSTSVYLTSPLQIRATQPYLDALHDAMHGKASDCRAHFIPAQQVRLTSPQAKSTLESAHQMARWVVTHDRIADRRLIDSRGDRLRILRYFSAPRSKYNVIVSTEVFQNELRNRLEDDVRKLLPDRQREDQCAVVDAIRTKATGLSGGILMRGSLWDNYARELLGVIVAQQELELMLAQSEGENHTVMFFLDEMRDWLELKGEMADILAVDLQAPAPDQRRVRMVVAEAKCVGKESQHKSRSKSWLQLEETYTAMVNRFQEHGSSVDPSIWFKRLADMLVEHMTGWAELERLGGWSFDEWIENIRCRNIEVEILAHSVVTVHDLASSNPDLDLRIADLERNRADRRKLAQWTLGSDLITKSIRGIVQPNAECVLHHPSAWPDETIKLAPPAEIEPTEPTPDSPSVPQAQAPIPRVSVDPKPKCQAKDSDEPLAPLEVPSGWQREVFDAVSELGHPGTAQSDQEWLKAQTQRLRQALQAEGHDAPVRSMRLTPNAGLVRVEGHAVDINWLIKHQVDLLVRHELEILRVTPRPGHIVVAIKRPRRSILHLADAWKRRKFESSSPDRNLALVIGEKEDDGQLLYLPLRPDFKSQEMASPHTLISGTTGSGKGILAANLILDICAFNDPRAVEIHLIDPKKGADYLWARDLPHLSQGIIEDRDSAIDQLEVLVSEMEQRYVRITQARCRNIGEFNRKRDLPDQMPYTFIFFDEVADWMQDDDFKKRVEKILNRIAAKARAAGLHLFMIYQRADKFVMTMQLRTNLGNKLILKLGDAGSSKIALGDTGAELLMGKGHMIADIGTGERVYCQVPFINPNEAESLAAAIQAVWAPNQE